jgi:hypothetical protein
MKSIRVYFAIQAPQDNNYHQKCLKKFVQKTKLTDVQPALEFFFHFITVRAL